MTSGTSHDKDNNLEKTPVQFSGHLTSLREDLRTISLLQHPSRESRPKPFIKPQIQATRKILKPTQLIKIVKKVADPVIVDEDDDEIEILSVSINNKLQKNGTNWSSFQGLGPSHCVPTQAPKLLTSREEAVFFIEDDETSDSADRLDSFTPPPPDLVICNTRSVIQTSENANASLSDAIDPLYLDKFSTSLPDTTFFVLNEPACPEFGSQNTPLSARPEEDPLFTLDNPGQIDVEIIDIDCDDDNQSLEFAEDSLCDLCGSVIKGGDRLEDHICEWLCDFCGIFFMGKAALDHHREVCEGNTLKIVDDFIFVPANCETEVLSPSAVLATNGNPINEEKIKRSPNLCPQDKDISFLECLSSKVEIDVGNKNVRARISKKQARGKDKEESDSDSVSSESESNKDEEESDSDSVSSESESNGAGSEVDLNDKKKENQADKVHTYRKMRKIGYVCEICNKTFKGNYDLAEHLILHSNQSSYDCDKCLLSYKRPMELHRHVIQVHRDRLERKIRRVPRNTSFDSDANNF